MFLSLVVAFAPVMLTLLIPWAWPAIFRRVHRADLIMVPRAWRRVPTRSRAIFGALTIAGCADETGTSLARDISLDRGTTTVPFAAPLVAAAGPHAVCFEFARPGDSQVARSLTVILESDDGVPDTVRGRADRIGESSVCLRDSTGSPRRYRALIIGAPHRAAVRHLEWRVPSGTP